MRSWTSPCCNWKHSKPCGPIPHDGCTQNGDCECAPYCACGCDAYGERCPEREVIWQKVLV